MQAVRINASVTKFSQFFVFFFFLAGNFKFFFFSIYSETNATNPQFRIRVPTGHPSKAHVVVAVAQKYECYRSRLFEDEQIGFTIYEIPPGMARVTPQYVCDQMPLDYAPLQNTREVATFFALPAGDFVVMPNSMQHREGKFLLRILADQHADVWEINEDNLVVHSITNDFADDRTIECVSIIDWNIFIFGKS